MAEPAVGPTPPREDLGERHARKRAYGWTLVLIAFVIILIVLAAANTRRVTVNWIVTDARTSLVFIVAAAGVLGWLAGIVTSVVVRHRARHKPRSQRRRRAGRQ